MQGARAEQRSGAAQAAASASGTALPANADASAICTQALHFCPHALRWRRVCDEASREADRTLMIKNRQSMAAVHCFQRRPRTEPAPLRTLPGLDGHSVARGLSRVNEQG